MKRSLRLNFRVLDIPEPVTAAVEEPVCLIDCGDMGVFIVFVSDAPGNPKRAICAVTRLAPVT
jgi:hypothetical protein